MGAATSVRPPARDRILESAYVLFSSRRVGDVGVNEVIARAKVTKATFYSHFPSKDDLVLAFLELRGRRATREWIETQVRARGATPDAQLLAIFDVLEEWFAEDDFAGCPFINVLFEFGAAHPNGEASVHHLNTVRAVVREIAQEGGMRDTDVFARAFHLLMKGAIVAAVERDPAAARTAKAMAADLIARHR